MADYITRHGGRIRYNTEVVRLNTSGKRITGVELANGEVLRPGQVISNISHHRVFATLLGEQKTAPRIYGMLNARHPGMSFFVVYLGLDATMEQLGITEYSWFIAPDMETSALKRRTANRLDPEPMLAAICLNAADPDASPEGTTILSIPIGTQPSAWADVKPEDYFGEKSRIAERVIAQFEKATGLDISGHIEEMDIAAPPTFARYTGSWDGRVYGYEPFPWDGIVPRVATKKRERVFRNLHFCGGNAYRAYGYGSSVMSGRSAADDVMKESAG